MCFDCSKKPFTVTTCPECCEECADGVLEVGVVSADSVVADDL